LLLPLLTVSHRCPTHQCSEADASFLEIAGAKNNEPRSSLDQDAADADAVALPDSSAYPQIKAHEWVQKMICNGEAYAAFNLALHYSKAEDRFNEEEAEVPFNPTEDEIQFDLGMKYERMKVFGNQHAVAVVYRRNEKDADGREVIHVVLQREVGGWHASKEVSATSEDFEWIESGESIKLGAYVGKKTQQLWTGKLSTDHPLGVYLLELEAIARQNNKTQKFIFSGISWGAALAQVISLRFESARQSYIKSCPEKFHLKHLPIPDMCKDHAQTFTLLWNGYRVTDDAGGMFAEKKLQGHIVHFICGFNVVPKGKLVYDPVPSLFAKFADVKTRYVFDENGLTRSCTNENNCPVGVGLRDVFQLTDRARAHDAKQCAEPNMHKLIENYRQNYC